MADEQLFENLPEQERQQAEVRGALRLRAPERSQVSMQVSALDDLVSEDHPVRAVWALVEGLDLSALDDVIKAREGQPGHPPAAPKLMLALWLWATIDGVGSARQLDRLCRDHMVYRWLCGGVSMNYHSLSTFRIAHMAVLERLLAQGVASMVDAGLVSLDTLAQDGLRVRAGAGASSFRRRARLDELLVAAQTRVERLRCEAETDPTGGNQRQRAAKERGARERVERIAAARDRMIELEAERERREKTNKKEVAKQKPPRASTTDADARVMKMADGGWRPAYNMQIISAPEHQVIIAVDIDTSGSDRGLAQPGIETVHAEGYEPSNYLVDGGFAKNDAIEWAHANDIKMWCPPAQTKHGTDPYAPKKGDGVGVADWRKRMKSEEGKAFYRLRCEHECINAHARRMGLRQLTLRGKIKARIHLLWFAIARNMMRFLALHAKVARLAA
jgi:transposase